MMNVLYDSPTYVVVEYPGQEGIEALIEQAAHCFAQPGLKSPPGATLAPARHLRLELREHAHFTWAVPQGGAWVAFCEHAPAEFGWSLPGAPLTAERAFGSHHHETAIASIGISDARPLHPDKVNDWLSYLLQTRGQDILRMKGVLSFRDEPRRYVFHGVHMVFDGQLERPWAAAERRNRLVFIGRNLDRQELEAGFESCVA
jgi:G3E family GTPase